MTKSKMLFRFTARTNAPKQRIEDQMQLWYLAHTVSYTLNNWQLFFFGLNVLDWKLCPSQEWKWLKTECFLKMFLRLTKFFGSENTHLTCKGKCMPSGNRRKGVWATLWCSASHCRFQCDPNYISCPEERMDPVWSQENLLYL